MHKKWIKSLLSHIYHFLWPMKSKTLICDLLMLFLWSRRKLLTIISFLSIFLWINGCKIFNVKLCFLFYGHFIQSKLLWNRFCWVGSTKTITMEKKLSNHHSGPFFNTFIWFLLLWLTLMASHRLTVRRLSVVSVTVDGFCSRKTIKVAHNQQKVSKFELQTLQNAK